MLVSVLGRLYLMVGGKKALCRHHYAIIQMENRQKPARFDFLEKPSAWGLKCCTLKADVGVIKNVKRVSWGWVDLDWSSKFDRKQVPEKRSKKIVRFKTKRIKNFLTVIKKLCSQSFTGYSTIVKFILICANQRFISREIYAFQSGCWYVVFSILESSRWCWSCLEDIDNDMIGPKLDFLGLF